MTTDDVLDDVDSVWRQSFQVLAFMLLIRYYREACPIDRGGKSLQLLTYLSYPSSESNSSFIVTEAKGFIFSMSEILSGEYQVIRVPITTSRSWDEDANEGIFRDFCPPPREGLINYPVSASSRIGKSLATAGLRDRMCLLSKGHRTLRFEDGYEVKVSGATITPKVAWIELDGNNFDSTRHCSKEAITITFLGTEAEGRVWATSGKFEIGFSDVNLLDWAEQHTSEDDTEQLDGWPEPSILQPEGNIFFEEFPSSEGAGMQQIRGYLDCLTDHLVSEGNNHWFVTQTYEDSRKEHEERNGIARSYTTFWHDLKVWATRRSDQREMDHAERKMEQVTSPGTLIGLVPAAPKHEVLSKDQTGIQGV